METRGVCSRQVTLFYGKTFAEFPVLQLLRRWTSCARTEPADSDLQLAHLLAKKFSINRAQRVAAIYNTQWTLYYRCRVYIVYIHLRTRNTRDSCIYYSVYNDKVYRLLPAALEPVHSGSRTASAREAPQTTLLFLLAHHSALQLWGDFARLVS